MGKKTFIVLGLLLFSALAFAQSGSPYWDFLRAYNTTTGPKLSDSLSQRGAKGDTSVVFYWNDLLPVGNIYVKMYNTDATAATVIHLPRIDFALLSDETTGDKYYKINDSTITAQQVGPDSNYRYSFGVGLKWDTTNANSRKNWYTLVDSAHFTIASGDTICRILPYDFRRWHARGIVFRGVSPATDSCRVRLIYMTGAKIPAGKAVEFPASIHPNHP